MQDKKLGLELLFALGVDPDSATSGSALASVGVQKLRQFPLLYNLRIRLFIEYPNIYMFYISICIIIMCIPRWLLIGVLTWGCTICFCL
jgi:hypothetical protein